MMNCSQIDPKRIVLPRWLPFDKAAHEREITTFAKGTPQLDRTQSILAFNTHLAEFRETPNPHIGAELMGIAVVLGQDDAARNLAEYVLSIPWLRPSVGESARLILGLTPKPSTPDNHSSLRKSKARVRNFPRDGLAWIDQARLYTIKGQYEKAERSVKVALYLCPNNRFVIRSAIRFYAHFGEWEKAFACAQRGFNNTHDPLVFGSLLGVSVHLERSVPRLKSFVEAALRSENILLNSETLESFGTLEILNGAVQRSKRFFKQAWVDPTVSVVGHSQWVIREHIPTLVAERTPDFNQSKEALGWLRYAMLDFSEVIPIIQEWSLEEPFSRAPYILGGNAACVLDSFDQAEQISMMGLLSNPKDPILQNNLAFSQLRKGRLREGEISFEPLRSRLDEPKEVAPIATKGLLLMMQGDLKGGTECYVTAIKRAKDLGDRRLVLRATLNYMISAIDVAKSVDIDVLKGAQAALKGQTDAACLGNAMGIVRRLEQSNLSGSDEISRASKEFCEVVKREVATFKNTLMANILERSAARPQVTKT